MNKYKIEKLIFYPLGFSLIFIFFYNIINYDPMSGYDAEGHHSYIDYIAMYLPRELKLPTVESSREFFSPPIPYLLPAFFQVICRNVLDSADLVKTCQPIYGIFAQIFQSLLYFLSLFFYMKLFKVIYERKTLFNLNVLLVISILTVNYRTFLMIRGEPYIIFLNSYLLYRFFLLLKNSFKYKKSDLIVFGLIIGALTLSRQWALLLFPAYFIILFFINSNEDRKAFFNFLVGSFTIGFLASSWFYFSLFFKYGTFTAFNMEPTPFSFLNQPRSFYLPDINSLTLMFSKPIRPNFANEFFPILYSDLWGDYWGYFAFTRDALLTGRNQALIGDYLARVNIVSIVPSILLIIGFASSYKYLKNKTKKEKDYFFSYIFISILISFTGYLWFLIKYPSGPSGDTNKAAYMIHAFHLLAILGINYLEKIKIKSYTKYIVTILLLVLTYIHNFSSMLSHY
tara:strand:+ start:2076 stop:3440 length:1365 start_codon:yes stop_codon:yes gene_type:complete